MALTFSGLVRNVNGSKRENYGVITFDSSYPTGGESLTPHDVGLSVIQNLQVEPLTSVVSTFNTSLQFAYDYTAQKLIAYEQGVRTSGTAAADTVNFVFAEDIAGADSPTKVGGPAVAINTNYSLGGLREVLNGANLSGVSCRYRATGR